MNTAKIQDPTADEMRAFLLKKYAGLIDAEDAASDIEPAIYWFASEWHGGQSSALYSALSTSPFSPGPIARRESESETVCDMICDLEEEFAGVDYSNQNPCGLALTGGPVWMLWHGGSSYAAPDHMRREDCEEFATIADALADFESRPGDGFYPCVSTQTQENGGPSAWVCFTDPCGVGDLYPDATLQFNARGVATIANG